MGHRSKFDLVKPQEPVRAGTVNRPTAQTVQELRYLLDRIEAADLGSALHAYSVAVEPAALVGHAVYFNRARDRFERGLATIEQQSVGALGFGPAADVWGIVSQKHTAESADLLIVGYGQVDIAAAVVGAVESGLYFLSGVSAGELTRIKPAVGIPVLRADGGGRVFVLPHWRDLLNEHAHYRFRLQPQPAGGSVTVDSGGQATIVDQDILLAGWLPADHATFSSLAPAGAKFGYNWRADAPLAAVWPPIPVSSAYLEWNRGTLNEYGAGVPLGTSQLCVINADGIWWMADCADQRPWDENRLNVSGHTGSDYYDDTVAQSGQCFTNFNGLTLWFNRPSVDTSNAVVTSLRSKAGSRITVKCTADGSAASTGNLELDFDFDFTSDTDNEAGYLAFKSIDGTEFKRGPVAEGVYTTSDQISLSGDGTTSVAIAGTARTVHHGRVRVDLNPATNVRELDVLLVKFEGAAEEYPLGIPVVMLPKSRTSAYVGKFNIPTAGLPANTKLKLRLQVSGSESGNLPNLALAYRVLPRGPSVVAVDAGEVPPGALPTMNILQTINLLGVTLADAMQYVEVETVPFNVAGGDTVVFKITRSATDAYTGDMYVVQQSGAMVAG